jgi:uncharacterized protein with HEPN domain
MKHPLRIEDYLQHITEAIDRITDYTQDVDNAAALQRDHKNQDAVIRNIEIIGEAANRIQRQAPEFVAAHPSLPWREIRGMRNRMVHDYFDVNVQVLWATVKDDLPKLRQQVGRLLLDLKKLDPKNRER